MEKCSAKLLNDAHREKQEFDETILAASGLLVCLHSSPHSIVNAYFLQQFYIEM